MSNRMILGAGMTGLSAGIATGLPVYEARSTPGGICSSYYMKAGDATRYTSPDHKAGYYRFEYGGGHWIFGGDPELLTFIEQYTPLKKYARSSAVYLPDRDQYIPYPLQYHLAHVDEATRAQALGELDQNNNREITSMADWVRTQFGQTLSDFFFAPFHELYTAGLWTRIRPQDNYKTPIDKQLVALGAKEKTPDVGYNAVFVYPEAGLDELALNMAAVCDVRYGHEVVHIDVNKKMVHFANNVRRKYDRIYSTLPLNHMVRMTGITVSQPPDPHSSVLVLNIGAERGPDCPDAHWIYVPRSRSGFHRVGYYSNVDLHFVPEADASLASLYIERAFLPTEKPPAQELAHYKREVENELREWGMIGTVHVNDATWIDVAYTWSWPGSTWIDEAIGQLEAHGITMLGRYGRWHFQGIAASIREGMELY